MGNSVFDAIFKRSCCSLSKWQTLPHVMSPRSADIKRQEYIPEERKMSLISLSLEKQEAKMNTWGYSVFNNCSNLALIVYLEVLCKTLLFDRLTLFEKSDIG